MLTAITFLTTLIFAVTYPLCFWISWKDPLKNNFHRFHIGLPVCLLGILSVFQFLLHNISHDAKILLLIPTAILFIVAGFSWRKTSPKPLWISIPCLLGIAAFLKIQNEFLHSSPGNFLAVAGITVLGGCILSASMYAMNLGHWYLNVHGLPIKHLWWSVNVLGALLILRIIWDAFFLLVGVTPYQGDAIPLYRFLGTMDGFILNIALLLGAVFPLVSLYFVRGTLEVKSTQSATGILYVILSAVLIGDLTYKYYLIRYGIAL